MGLRRGLVDGRAMHLGDTQHRGRARVFESAPAHKAHRAGRSSELPFAEQTSFWVSDESERACAVSRAPTA